MEKWPKIRVRFFTNFWLWIRIRKKKAESSRSQLRKTGSSPTSAKHLHTYVTRGHRTCFGFSDDRIVVFYYPNLSCFWKMISVSFPNPVLVEIILSVSENYPKVYYDAQHTFSCFVYFASWGKITLELFCLQLKTIGWSSHMTSLKRMSCLVEYGICKSSAPCMDDGCHGFRAGK